jgi:hypothetical protein
MVHLDSFGRLSCNKLVKHLQNKAILYNVDKQLQILTWTELREYLNQQECMFVQDSINKSFLLSMILIREPLNFSRISLILKYQKMMINSC